LDDKLTLWDLGLCQGQVECLQEDEDAMAILVLRHWKREESYSPYRRNFGMLGKLLIGW